MNKRQVVFVGIVVIAAILRLYRLDSLPPSLEWDEVATGYDAYSILRTGKDQYGNFLPLTIRSLDDYKPPLYTYLTTLSIALLGWNDFSVRFPAALLGVLAVATTYGMTNALLRNRKIALLTALLLAISPWHVNFSRLALETNSTIFFTTAGVWAFLSGLRKGKYLIVSSILFGLDLFLYHNARVFVPVFIVILLAVYFRELRQHKKAVVVFLTIMGIFILRLIPIATSIEGQMRFAGTSVFTEATPLDIADTKELYRRMRLADGEQGVSMYGRIFHNQYVLFGLKILNNYLTHFDPNFWVFTDDYPRHHMPEMGIIYVIELPLLVAGFFFLARRFDRKVFIIIVAWILLAPIPAAVTRDVPHALRSEIILPAFQISIAAALAGFYSLLKNRFGWQKVLMGLVTLAYFVNVSFFLHKFLFHFARETSEYWQYGRREAALFTESVKDRYQRILVSPRLGQPHIFWLYYLRYDPAKYLSEGGTYSGGWAEERNRFDTYEFRSIDYDRMQGTGILLVGLPVEFPKRVEPLKKIYYLNGKEAIWIVDK